MSSYPSDDAAQPATPIYDQTLNASPAAVAAVPRDLDQQGGTEPRGTVDERGAADQAEDAANQAASTVQDAAGQAKEQAKDVGAGAKEAGANVASTTKEQASRVASDAWGQAKELYGQAGEELSSQAATQQQRLTAGLKSFGEDLSQMGSQHDAGIAAEFVHAVSGRASQAGAWLESRSPAEVLDEVTQLAARRPVLFIDHAAGTGVIAPRLTKALVADAKNDATAPSASASSAAPAPGARGTSGFADAGSVDFGNPE